MTFLFLLPYQLRIAHACPVDVLRPTHHRDMLGAPASRFSCRSVLALAVFEVRVSPAGPRACGIIGICVKVYSQRLNDGYRCTKLPRSARLTRPQTNHS
jgi:hypothetical protein